MEMERLLCSIDGVPALRASKRPYSILGDRIEAATYAIAAVMTRGSVTLTGAPIEDLSFLCNICNKLVQQWMYTMQRQ